MSEPTPAPWERGGRVHLTDPFGTEFQYLVIERVPEVTGVGGVAFLPIIEGCEEEVEANARLIIAAHEMHDALTSFPEREKPVDEMSEAELREYVGLELDAWRLEVRNVALEASEVNP